MFVRNVLSFLSNVISISYKEEYMSSAPIGYYKEPLTGSRENDFDKKNK